MRPRREVGGVSNSRTVNSTNDDLATAPGTDRRFLESVAQLEPHASGSAGLDAAAEIRAYKIRDRRREVDSIAEIERLDP